MLEPKTKECVVELSRCAIALPGHSARREAADLDTLLRRMRLKDPCTELHAERVGLIAGELGRLLGLSDAAVEALKISGRLHDIGKLCVPDQILKKPSTLTSDEWRVIRSHPDAGLRLVRGLNLPSTALEIIAHHHERWDGSGYPYGLRGMEIPLPVRLFQIADIYDALASARPYKISYSRAQIELVFEREVKRGWRDPELVDWFVGSALDDIENANLDLSEPLSLSA